MRLVSITQVIPDFPFGVPQQVSHILFPLRCKFTGMYLFLSLPKTKMKVNT